MNAELAVCGSCHSHIIDTILIFDSRQWERPWKSSVTMHVKKCKSYSYDFPDKTTMYSLCKKNQKFSKQ